MATAEDRARALMRRNRQFSGQGGGEWLGRVMEPATKIIEKAKAKVKAKKRRGY